MSNSAAKMLVYVSDRLVCIKISGRANFTASVDFRTLSDELVAKGYKCFILDLTDCLLMDSTFLGILAGFGLKMAVPLNGQPRTGLIEVMNPNSRILDSLENLGIAHLFKLVDANTCQPHQTDSASTVETANPSRVEVTRTCLEAHKILMSVDPANVSKFKDVAQFLAEDLKKLANGS